LDGRKGPRERHDGFTAKRKKIFLEALAKTGTIADACRIAAVSRRTFYYHRDRWGDFARACEAATARAAGAIETLAWERATLGAEEVLIRDGAVVQVRRKPSDAILRMLLMASNPKKYGRMARMRRKEIEKELRARIEKEVWAAIEAEQPPIEQVRDELIGRLDAIRRHRVAHEGYSVGPDGGLVPPAREAVPSDAGGSGRDGEGTEADA
jgi:hypothetical protein